MAIQRGTAVEFGRGLTDIYGRSAALIMSRVAKMLGRGLGQPDWATKRLLELGDLRRFTEELMAQTNSTAQGQAIQGVLDAMAQGRRAAQLEIEALGARTDLSPTMRATVERARALLATGSVPQVGQATRLAAALTGRLDGMTVPIVRSTLDSYREIIGQATGGSILGAETQRESAQKAYAAFVKRGITGFTDRVGKRWKLDTYADMATRTALTQASVEAHNDQLGQLGIDLVQVSNVAGECVRCRPWEGKILTRGGAGGERDVQTLHGIEDRTVTVHVAGSVEEAIAAGLLHPNCRHSLGAYIPGATSPITHTEDVEGDRARQKQRSLERQLRAERLASDTALTTKARRAADARAKALSAELDTHVTEAGLFRSRGRERVNQGLGRLPGQARRKIKAPPPPPPPARPPVQPPTPPPSRRPPADPRAALHPAGAPTAVQEAARRKWLATGSGSAPTKASAHDRQVLQHNRDELTKAQDAVDRTTADIARRRAAGTMSQTELNAANAKLSRQIGWRDSRRTHVATYQAKIDTEHLPPYDPADPLSMYGGRLHISGGFNEHTYENMAEVEAYVPASAHTLVRDDMAEGDSRSGLYYGTDLTPDMDDLSFMRKKASADGRTGDEIGGVYYPSRRVCASSSHAYAVARSAGHVGMHEFGHALDSALGRATLTSTGEVSDVGSFRTAVEQLERDHGSLIAPYFRASSTTSAGHAETFANAYSYWRRNLHAYGGNELALRVGASITNYPPDWPTASIRDAMIKMGQVLIDEMTKLGLEN